MIETWVEALGRRECELKLAALAEVLGGDGGRVLRLAKEGEGQAPHYTELARANVRQAILDAALVLFRKDGCSGLSMRRLADSIGYTPKTIYLYFTDKDDLLSMINDHLKLHDTEEDAYGSLLAVAYHTNEALRELSFLLDQAEETADGNPGEEIGH